MLPPPVVLVLVPSAAAAPAADAAAAPAVAPTPGPRPPPPRCSSCHATGSRAASGTTATRQPAPVSVRALMAAARWSCDKISARAGVFPCRAADSSCACPAVSSPSTAMSCPSPLPRALMPSSSPSARDGRTTARVSSSVSRNDPCPGTSPSAVTSLASNPSPARCTPIDAAVVTASSNSALEYPSRRVSRNSDAVLRQNCSSRRTISSP